MSTKLSDEMLDRLQETEKTNPQLDIPVIVTIIPGADLTDLEQHGLKIHRVFEAISAVAGTLTAARAKEFAELEQVEKIEFDGTVWAL